MKKEDNYYIVEGSILPDVCLKVLEADKYMLSGKAKNISEATDMAKISRSAYYKYKDKVKPFNQLATDSIITFSCTLFDKPGILSNILANFAKCGANILTINQNIPSNDVAILIIAARTANMKMSIDSLIKKSMQIEGVIKFDILSSM